MKLQSKYTIILFIISITFAGCGGSSKSHTPATQISLNKSSTAIMAGSSEQLSAVVTPNQTLTWSSSDNSVATVSADGLVTAVARGTALITAAAGSSSASCDVRTLEWTHPSDLSDNISINENEARYPQVAMDNSGNAVIVWEQFLDTPVEGYQVFMSEYRDGWSHPDDATDYINPENTSMTVPYPQTAMDNNENAIIVWLQSNDKVFISEYRNSTWDHPSGTDDFSGTTGTAHDPQVAMSDNGDAIVVWWEDNTSDIIYIRTYQNGAWQATTQINDKITESTAYLPKVAMDNEGNAVIAWQQSDGSDNQIFISEYRSGTWTHPQDSEDHISIGGTHAYSPGVAMDNNGSTIIAWRQNDGEYDRIYKSEYREGTWTYPADLDDAISPGGTDIDDPRIVMDNNGNAIIVWEQKNGDSDGQIFLSEYRDGAWTIPGDLNDNISPDDSSAYAPQAAMDDNGNAIIVWVQDATGSNDYRIFKSEYHGGSWTHPSINDYISPGGQTDSYPQVAMDNTGNAAIVWSQEDGSGDGQIFISECR